jgi:hypothetical protein
VKKLFVALLLATLVAAPANAAVVVAKGIHGESISVPTNSFKSGALVTVTGTHFDESVGIYLAYCVLPAKGAVPTPCGGGANKTGIGDASYWISSNPPPYGKGLAIPYKPGGRFTQKLLISRFIGKTDCKKIKCAITVRADHLMSQDRSYDLFIPVVIK